MGFGAVAAKDAATGSRIVREGMVGTKSRTVGGITRRIRGWDRGNGKGRSLRMSIASRIRMELALDHGKYFVSRISLF